MKLKIRKRIKNGMKNVKTKVNVVGGSHLTDDGFWEVKIDKVSACSKMPDNVNVYITPIVKAKIDAMMDEYSSIEWLAYLKGEPKDDGNYLIRDLVFPDSQTISSASVSDIEFDSFNEHDDIVGVIHSHHNMGIGFSHTDDEFINGNHNVSILVANGGKAEANVRLKTPCGAIKDVKGTVRIHSEVDFDKNSFLSQIKPQIKRYTARTVVYRNGFGGIGFGNFGNKFNKKMITTVPTKYDNSDPDDDLMEELKRTSKPPIEDTIEEESTSWTTEEEETEEEETKDQPIWHM